MIEKFLLRGPIELLICLAIGFAIVCGGGCSSNRGAQDIDFRGFIELNSPQA